MREAGVQGEHPQAAAALTATGERDPAAFTTALAGTIKSVTGPANAKGRRSKLDYMYKPATGTHVTAVQDSFGLRLTSTYNLKYGLVEAAAASKLMWLHSDSYAART